MIRIQKQLVVKEDVELGYGKVIQKRTVDDTIVDREYDRINAGNIPAKNPVGSETDIQTELDSKLDVGLGDLYYAKINGNPNEEFEVADAPSDTHAANLGQVNSAVGQHESNHSNPHAVTKSQVGLGNADNTSDLDKPISNATQSALNSKAPLTHLNDYSNPHSVTAAQVGADPSGSAAAVQANLNVHTQSNTEHGLVDDGSGNLYLADDGIYKAVPLNGSHNELADRDALDSHPVSAITGLQTALDAKLDDGDAFLKTEHIVASAGTPDAGKPIILNGDGQIDASLMGQGLYFVAMYTPESANEYPDDTGENTGAFWGVDGVDAVNGYTFTGGDLLGATVYNGDMVVRGEQEWGYRNFGNVAGMYLRLDGTSSMEADLPMGTHKIVNLAPGTAAGDAVEFSQITSFATDFVRVDGSIPMEAALDMGTAAVTNMADGTADTDAVSLGQFNTHALDASNPHSVTAAQAGAEPDLGVGAAGQILATDAAATGKEWIDVPISLPDATGKQFNELATDGSASDAAAWSPFRLSPKTIGFNATIATGSNATIGSFTLEDTYTITVEDGGTLIVV